MQYAIKYNFDNLILLHGDGQYAPEYLEKLVEPLVSENIDYVWGSRMINKKGALKGGMPLYKFIGNIFLTGIFNLLYGTKFADCHTGYWAYNLKLIKNDIFKNLDDGFCFDIYLRLQLVSDKKLIKEIPIETFYGSERSAIHLIYAIRFFFKTIVFKIFN